MISRLAVFLLLLSFSLMSFSGCVWAQMTPEFGDPKKRPKKVLLLPAIVELTETIDGVESRKAILGESYAPMLNQSILDALNEKGFEVVLLGSADKSATGGLDPAKILQEATLDELPEYHRKPKGLRYNWYGVERGVRELRSLYQVDSFVVVYLDGTYSATSPSTKQLATSVFAGALAGAITGGGVGRVAGISATNTFSDQVRMGAVFIDPVSGKFDAQFSRSFSYSNSLLKSGEKGEKAISKALRKLIKKIPNSKKRVKVQIVTELYEMKQRPAISDEADELMLQEIEQLLEG